MTISPTSELDRRCRPGQWSLGLWWTGLLVLHGINVCYYAGVTTVYTSFSLSYVYIMIQSLSIGIDNTHYTTVSAIHAAVAAVHAMFMLLMVGCSIRARRLVFQLDFSKAFQALCSRCGVRNLLCCVSPSRVASSVAVAGVDDRKCTWFRCVAWLNTGDQASSSETNSRTLSQSIVKTGSLIFAHDGILGVDSVFFDHVLLLRELVETTLQTYQAYRMSQLLPRLWLNRLYVALLVVNCWCIPILHRYYRHREITRRLLCLLCDAVLDVISSIGISLIIFTTYLPQYTEPDGYGFPFPNWYNDRWLANMQQEFEMMLIASWADMSFRLVFALGLLQCMEAIKGMLTRLSSETVLTGEGNGGGTARNLASSQTSFVLTAKAAGVFIPRSARSAHEIIDERSKRGESMRPSLVQEAGTYPPSDRAARSSRWKPLVDFLVHIAGPSAFVLWGFTVLTIHIMAEAHPNDGICTLQLRPWLSNKSGCSIIDVNCHEIQSNGHDQLLEAELTRFDAERAARIVFRHCPALVIPPKIQEFRNMAGLKIYNSTLLSWPASSALTGTHHSCLRSLYLTRVELPDGEIPPGLLDNDFPPLMAELSTCVTNLRTLPDDLDRKWPPRMVLAFEFSRLVAIPQVVLRLQPITISMAGSPVTSVPAELFEIQSLQSVVLAMTLVEELPSNVTRLSPVMNVLFLHNTRVSKFWSWMDDFIEYSMLFPVKLFNAHATPYCLQLEEISSGARSSFSQPATAGTSRIMDVSTPEKLEFAKTAIECGPGIQATFPLSLEDAINGLP